MPAAATPPARTARRRFVALTLAILATATIWRIAIAAQMPALARDGVTFCWYAQGLGDRGLGYLNDPAAQQHPLYPALILAAQRLATTFGAPDSPWTWQISGQFVAGIAGLAVILLAGALTLQLARKLDLPLDPRRAALLAMLLAAFVPLNIWLSVDAMSDQVHLAFYLGAVLCLLSLRRLPVAIACGLLTGLAFLTRQEGIVPLAAGWVALFFDRNRPARPRLASAAGLTLAFLLIAAPYWSLVGGFSQKKNPADWFLHHDEETAACWPASTLFGQPSARISFENDSLALTAGDPLTRPARQTVAPTASHSFTFAKLEPVLVGWYLLVPYAIYMLFRAGRVIVPLLALLPIVNLRRRLLAPPLAGLTACFAGHFLLTLILLQRYQYLSTRHMLVLVMLLVPFAAFLLARLQELASQYGRRSLAWVAVAVPLLPLMIYGLRVPNAHDGFLLDAARWLRAHDGNIRQKRLISGSSGRRIAFYAGMAWDPWYEKPEELDELMRAINAGGPGYLAIEVGTGYERAGNAALVERLRADPVTAACLEPLAVLPGPDEKNKLHVFAVHPADEPPHRRPAEPLPRVTP